MLHYTNGMSGREIAEATGDGKTTVNEFLKRFRECEELSYPLSEEVTNEFIAERLYRKAGKPAAAELYRDFDPEEVCRTLTKKGETLKHLWKKYNAFGIRLHSYPIRLCGYWFSANYPPDPRNHFSVRQRHSLQGVFPKSLQLQELPILLISFLNCVLFSLFLIPPF